MLHMSISLSGKRPDSLSPPPLSELSDSERSPRTSTSAAPSPLDSPSSSRTSVNAPDSSNISCCNWIFKATAGALVKVTQLSDGQSFAIMNFVWVLCSAFCWVFHNKLCNFFFRCGCTWNWSGSWDRYASYFLFEHTRALIYRSDAMSTMRVVHDARGVQRPVVSATHCGVFRIFVTKFQFAFNFRRRSRML